MNNSSKLLQRRTYALRRANKLARWLHERFESSSDAELSCIVSDLVIITERALPKNKKKVASKSNDTN